MIKFTDFSLQTPLLSSDYLVGYKSDGSAELRTTVKDVLNLVETTNAAGSQVVHVDKNRTDTYTPDGSELKPFKTIREAFTFVGDASSSSDFVNVNKRYWSVKVAAGSYDETAGGSLNIPKRFFVKLDLSDGVSVIGNLVRDVSGLIPNSSDNPVFLIEGTSNRPYYEFAGTANRTQIGIIGNISMIHTVRGTNALHLFGAGVRKVEYSGSGGQGHFFTDSNSTWDTVYSPTKQVTFYTYNTQNSPSVGGAGNLIGNIFIANVSDTRWIFSKSIFTTSQVFFRLGANISLPSYSERRASTFTRSGNVATVTLTENHGFSLVTTSDGYTGEQYILVQGVSENTSFNTPAFGAKVIAYPTSNSIQYESTGTDVTTPVTAASAKMIRGAFFGNANPSSVSDLGADGRFSESAAMTFNGFAQASELGATGANLRGFAKGVSYSMPLTSWPASTILTKNTVLILDDQFQYRTTTGVGRTSAVQPTFPTAIGQTVNDGFVTWLCEENALNRFDIPSFNVQSKLERLSNAKNIYLKSNVLSAKNVKDALEQTYTFVQANSANWEESAEIIPTVTNYLSTNNVLVSSLNVLGNVLIQNNGGLTVSGNISGYNLRTSFNQGLATGNFSFAVGSGGASGIYSHAEGINTIASGFGSRASGTDTVASGVYAASFCSGTSATNEASFAEGVQTISSGIGSHAEGGATVASGNLSHAEGTTTIASGFASHAEGETTTASGVRSHAEGLATTASGPSSHAQNSVTVASGTGSHAEGGVTVASGNFSHAEGQFSRAIGQASHAAGIRATALQNYTYAWSDGNLGTLTQNVSTTRTGQYMVSASGGVFIPGNVGIGTDNNSNALTVNGNTEVTNLTITDNLSAPVHITDLTTTKTFLSSDTSRVFHFDTTTQPLCAIFPPTLPNGFNVAIMNTGTNNLRLSASQLNSVGITIGVRYGGAFVYKDNNQLFAVGRL